MIYNLEIYSAKRFITFIRVCATPIIFPWVSHHLLVAKLNCSWKCMSVFPQETVWGKIDFLCCYSRQVTVVKIPYTNGQFIRYLVRQHIINAVKCYLHSCYFRFTADFCGVWPIYSIILLVRRYGWKTLGSIKYIKGEMCTS